jgi:hypothetical protein
MKFPGWTPIVVACLRDKQFWCETARETLYLIGGSSLGIGAALTAAMLGIMERVMRSGQARGSLRNRKQTAST